MTTWEFTVDLRGCITECLSLAIMRKARNLREEIQNLWSRFSATRCCASNVDFWRLPCVGCWAFFPRTMRIEYNSPSLINGNCFATMARTFNCILSYNSAKFYKQICNRYCVLLFIYFSESNSHTNFDSLFRCYIKLQIEKEISFFLN